MLNYDSRFKYSSDHIAIKFYCYFNVMYCTAEPAGTELACTLLLNIQPHNAWLYVVVCFMCLLFRC